MGILLLLWFIIMLVVTKGRLHVFLSFVLPVLLGVWISLWVTVILFWIIIIIFLILDIKDKAESGININYQNISKNKSNNRWSNIYNMQLPELFEKYEENSLVPPLNSLVPRAYEKWDITSWKNNFDLLNDKDKKTILRIAINIWNKRKKDIENKKNIEEKTIKKQYNDNYENYIQSIYIQNDNISFWGDVVDIKSELDNIYKIYRNDKTILKIKIQEVIKKWNKKYWKSEIQKIWKEIKDKY